MVYKLPIRNTRSSNLKVHVEPWGEQVVLAENEVLELVFYGPKGGKPEIDIASEEVLVHGWESSRVFILRNNLCIIQPALIDIIKRLAQSKSVSLANFALDSDVLEYSQVNLDSAVSWDADGRYAAFQAVNRTAPMLGNLENNEIVWAYCESVLHSRGIFLSEDVGRRKAFFNELKNSGDLLEYLVKWYEESALDRDSVESTLST